MVHILLGVRHKNLQFILSKEFLGTEISANLSLLSVGAVSELLGTLKLSDGSLLFMTEVWLRFVQSFVD